MSDMHVVFCISDNYTPLVAITLQSFVDHHTSDSLFVFHIVSEELSSENYDYLSRIVAQRHNWQLCYHPIDQQKLTHIPTGPFTLHTWYRVFLGQLLPEHIDKVLYLDADTLVTAPIEELFTISLENKAVGAVKDQQNFISATKRDRRAHV